MKTKTKDGKTHPWRARQEPLAGLGQFAAENKAVPFKHNPLNRGPGYRRK